MLLKKYLAGFVLAPTLLIIALLIATPNTVSAANISSPSYAWSESVGWIKFDSGVGAVNVTNTGITGHAYNDNIGWIVLDGVANDGNGTLSGYAWSESVGYIDFNDVTISGGQFSGYAYNDNIGFISFNCSNTDTCGVVDYKVSTTWAPAVDEPAPEPRRSGSSGSRRVAAPTTPAPETVVTTKTQNQLSPTQILDILVSAGLVSGDEIEKIRAILESIIPQTSNNSEFTRDLDLNDTGADVMALQKFLNANGFTLATTGAGSPGNETTYFGPATRSALARFQASNNILPSVGYFGPLTRAFIANMQ